MAGRTFIRLTHPVIAAGIALFYGVQVEAASDSETKKLLSEWSIDVSTGATKSESSKRGSKTVNGAGTTLGVSEKVLTTSREVVGSVRLSNVADASRSVTVQIRWIGRAGKNNGLSLLREDKKTLEVPSGREIPFSFSSGQMEVKDVSLTGRQLGIDGSKIIGWTAVVRENASQTVIFSKASLHELEQFAR